jgi:hypothetical protein
MELSIVPNDIESIIRKEIREGLDLILALLSVQSYREWNFEDPSSSAHHDDLDWARGMARRWEDRKRVPPGFSDGVMHDTPCPSPSLLTLFSINDLSIS